METKIKLAGHPVHPMLTAFPIAFYTATLACFIVYSCTKNVFWFQVALVANIAGVGSALVAAVPGLIDWLYLPNNSEAKTTGSLHLLLNSTALFLFGTNAFMQYPKWNVATSDSTWAIILSACGMVCTIAAGYQGWKMVQTHHVGIDIPGTNERTGTKK